VRPTPKKAHQSTQTRLQPTMHAPPEKLTQLFNPPPALAQHATACTRLEGINGIKRGDRLGVFGFVLKHVLVLAQALDPVQECHDHDHNHEGEGEKEISSALAKAPAATF
jgi:hypothetical protein